MAQRAAGKSKGNPAVGRREPRQKRALAKIGLMLEAAIRLIEEGGTEALTTNAIAARAGVSIGTLYQYFDGKDAILDALAKQEVAGTTERVKAAMAAPPQQRGGRIPMLLNAVLASYGGRRVAHRRVMTHVMSRGRAGGMNPLFAHIIDALSNQGLETGGGAPLKLSAAQAFVLTHAMAGVMRGVLTTGKGLPPREEIEVALTQLVTGFAAASAPST
ncbi:MAG TPA: TetR/AcrR family transcriptional regulator [Dyella sp.]|uniref:TetR/AcrR family transcriptional regulator n=1 Tax=Dyella sp. TaxID=1869338 RepID=UPI002D7911AE|nr:TetR/AcrR family transcriptional regulator [Dyella sp.]HET6554449.1 TetR/AcrR family transcriptional regulator [Dyella sp.]